MQRNSFIALGAVITLVGFLGACLPAILQSGHPVATLRANAHGYHSTTTTFPAPARLPEHRWRNEAQPSDAVPAIPESGGTPGSTP
jgi:hypothetical protein